MQIPETLSLSPMCCSGKFPANWSWSNRSLVHTVQFTNSSSAVSLSPKFCWSYAAPTHSRHGWPRLLREFDCFSSAPPLHWLIIDSDRLMVEWFNLSINQRRNQYSLLCKIAFQFIWESEHRVLTQEEAEEEAVLWANLKRNLANKALVCLHKLSIDVTDRCCYGIVRR